jgi:signal transduction histidine kinase
MAHRGEEVRLGPIGQLRVLACHLCFRARFLTAMSHELRTPLNAIQGYAQLIEMGLHGPVTDEQKVALNRINQSQHHLLALITDILNFAKIESGRIDFAVTDVPLFEAVERAVVLVAPQMHAQGLRFELVPCVQSLTMRADPERFQQIIVNLLANAMKFTLPRDGQAGAVTVSCDRCDPVGWFEPNGPAMVAVRVRDTGCGIPANKFEAIFDPFVQIDRNKVRQSQQGVGLGLAISRELARAMNGELTVESVEGEGSTFIITMPQG